MSGCIFFDESLRTHLHYFKYDSESLYKIKTSLSFLDKVFGSLGNLLDTFRDLCSFLQRLVYSPKCHICSKNHLISFSFFLAIVFLLNCLLVIFVSVISMTGEVKIERILPKHTVLRDPFWMLLYLLILALQTH